MNYLTILKIFFFNFLIGKNYADINDNYCQDNNFNADIGISLKAITHNDVSKHSNLSLSSIENVNNIFQNASINNFFENECDKDKINYLPNILIVLLAKRPVPFFDEFLDNILNINYPKCKIDLFLYCNASYHDELFKKFISINGNQYKSYKIFLSSETSEVIEEAWNIEMQQFEDSQKTDYVFVVDNDVQIDNPNILIELLAFKKSFIAPILTQENYLISNFWGTVSKTSQYVKSQDYMNIVKGTLRGIWSATCVISCYLVEAHVLSSIKFINFVKDAEISLCNEIRNKDIHMNIVNVKNYGHLMNADDFNTSLIRPEFYEYFTNPKDWEKRYIHPDYSKQLNSNYKHLIPCPDVYWFPMVTDTFCDELIALAENYGIWTGGVYQTSTSIIDPVPTSDIYMKQLNLQEFWLAFLNDYIQPLQEVAFEGYYSYPIWSRKNFIVRYKPEEQAYLRQHLDTSTYTINLALNTPNVDYIGGGCRFIRYNCSVIDTKRGWMLMHPGYLTHLHEGLRVTNGTRYILVSFIDP